MSILLKAWYECEQNEIIEHISKILYSNDDVIVEAGFLKNIWDKIKNLFNKNKIIDLPISKSSCISHIFYKPKEKVLRLTFKNNGRVYEYKNVDDKAALRLVAAMSIGKQFWSEIRPNFNKYPYKEI